MDCCFLWDTGVINKNRKPTITPYIHMTTDILLLSSCHQAILPATICQEFLCFCPFNIGLCRISVCNMKHLNFNIQGCHIYRKKMDFVERNDSFIINIKILGEFFFLLQFFFLLFPKLLRVFADTHRDRRQEWLAFEQLPCKPFLQCEDLQ